MADLRLFADDRPAEPRRAGCWRCGLWRITLLVWDGPALAACPEPPRALWVAEGLWVEILVE